MSCYATEERGSETSCYCELLGEYMAFCTSCWTVSSNNTPLASWIKFLTIQIISLSRRESKRLRMACCLLPVAWTILWKSEFDAGYREEKLLDRYFFNNPSMLNGTRALFTISSPIYRLMNVIAGCNKMGRWPIRQKTQWRFLAVFSMIGSLLGIVGPARSPYLSPCDFFLWGCMKNRVFATNPTSIVDLKATIMTVSQSIDVRTLRKVFQNMMKRAKACLSVEGGHFEHFLWIPTVSSG